MSQVLLAAELNARVEQTVKSLKSPNTDQLAAGYRLPVLDLAEFAARQFPPRNPVVAPWLSHTDLAMVFGPRGAGKTHFCLRLALSIAAGHSFLGWEVPAARNVLYLDFEMAGVALQQRLLMHKPEHSPEPGYFRLFSPDLLSRDEILLDLSSAKGQAIIEAAIEDSNVIFIDNLSAACRTGKENEGESWLPVAEWLGSLRRQGITVVLVHHAGKNGQQRGTSRREDALDVVLSLRRPSDYDSDQGCKFEIHFEKARHLSGDESAGLAVCMATRGEVATWTHEPLKESTFTKVVELASEGLSQADIAGELNLNKSTVSRHLARARSEGRLRA